MRVKPKAPKRLLDNDIVSPAKSPEKKATVKTPVRVSGRKQTPKMITEPPSKVVKVKKEDKVAKTGDKVAKKSSTRTPRATVVKAKPKKGRRKRVDLVVWNKRFSKFVLKMMPFLHFHRLFP